MPWHNTEEHARKRSSSLYNPFLPLNALSPFPEQFSAGNFPTNREIVLDVNSRLLLFKIQPT